jgi:hypothetical protein
MSILKVATLKTEKEIRRVFVLGGGGAVGGTCEKTFIQ